MLDVQRSVKIVNKWMNCDKQYTVNLDIKYALKNKIAEFHQFAEIIQTDWKLIK